MYIAQTAARVPYVQYADEWVRDWIGSPKAVEKKFVRKHGHWIAHNYLEKFRADLNKLHDAIVITKQPRFRDESRVFEYTGMIFIVKMFIDLQGNKLILKEIIIRPCAEGNKFFLIILYHLIRCCHMYHLDFLVESPLDATIGILNKYFKDEIVITEEVIPQSFLLDDIREYMVLKYDTMRGLLDPVNSLGIKLGLTGNPDSKLLDYDDPGYERTHGPQIICNPSQFPCVAEMH